MSEIESFSPGSGRRVWPRARVASDAAEIDLSGTWRFRFSARPDLAPDGAEAVDLDDSGWDEIDVPSHWVLQGRDDWGRPAYTNVNFPFPVEPPHVPDDNPTGDYRVAFYLPEGFGERVLLRFDGVESLAIASLNGVRVGVVRGSRLAQELDVTEEARPGRNVLHVRVHQWSAASYVEDQDQWWLPGIFRPVTVLARPAAGIDDVWLRADFDPETGEGTLLPELRAGDAAFPVTVTIDELGLAATFDSPADVAPIPAGPVAPWSADRPRLYQARVANAAETRSLRVGFRRIEIVGHEWRVNGRKLRIRGVNRHEYDPDHGRVFDKESVRAQLHLMKRHNINAVRTSHYPPHPDFFELTDEIGLWVIDECDLETHGFESGGWVDNPTDDPRWREALVDRAIRMFERDKNHPSIVAWSLGNESWTGANAAAMAAWLHRRDPERPVHYEPDFEGRYTDMVSRMYATVEEMEDMSAGTGRNLHGSPGRNAELASRPMILCEYLHAMGNGAGAVVDYEQRFDTLPQWHGGFAWEWRDHGLRTTTPDGVEYFGYGGDFGEQLHDGSFVCDGMVLSDGTPTTMLAEYAAVVTPIKLTVSDGELGVENRRHDGDTADLRVLWRDEVDGHEVASGEVDIRPVAPGELVCVELPPFHAPETGELWRTVEAVTADDGPWAAAGHVVSRVQALLAEAPTPPRRPGHRRRPRGGRRRLRPRPRPFRRPHRRPRRARRPRRPRPAPRAVARPHRERLARRLQLLRRRRGHRLARRGRPGAVVARAVARRRPGPAAPPGPVGDAGGGAADGPAPLRACRHPGGGHGRTDLEPRRRLPPARRVGGADHGLGGHLAAHRAALRAPRRPDDRRLVRHRAPRELRGLRDRGERGPVRVGDRRPGGALRRAAGERPPAGAPGAGAAGARPDPRG